MKQVLSTISGVEVMDVPAPLLQAGHVLVEVEYSFVSSGTELTTIVGKEAQSGGLTSHVATNPDLIGKVVSHLKERGIRKTVSAISSHVAKRSAQSEKLVALGYSCAGKIIGVAEGVKDYAKGDLVACAGSGKASHAELVVVPTNLIVKIPTGLDTRAASSVAIGAIAMQAVRRADVKLGESVAVVGLGLIGLVTAQLLKIAGARVIGFDTDGTRVSLARSIGIDDAYSDAALGTESAMQATRHMGVDTCLLTASSSTSDVIDFATSITRKRGRIVVVGAVRLDIDRKAFLPKEIDLVASSSYGPGRYDDRYEEAGLDYPYAFVRWTENRNMEEYLHLLQDGRIQLDDLVVDYPLESARIAYDRLQSKDHKPVAVILKYPGGAALNRSQSRVEINGNSSSGKLSFGIIGAGEFVTGTHLPNLQRLGKKVELAAIVNRSGENAVGLARRFGARYATTSVDEVLDDASVDAVVIGTRHDSHADLVIRALRAGKHVLVEKPLAMTVDELTRIEVFLENQSNQSSPLLLTGFNRRFAPLMIKLKNDLDAAGGPFVLNYQVNAGFIPPEHWLRSPTQGGGRNIGEACHIYDLFTYLTGSTVTKVVTSAIRPHDESHARNENFMAGIEFSDGSVANLMFTSMGSSRYPKELLHAYGGKTAFVLTDYVRLEKFGPDGDSTTATAQDKGHAAEMDAFVGAIMEGGEWPIPLWQQIQATKIANIVEEQLASGGDSN